MKYTFKDQDIIDVCGRVAGAFSRDKSWISREDAIQEAICLAYEEIPKFDQDLLARNEDPLGYLGWIIKNRLVDWQRKEKALYSKRRDRDPEGKSYIGKTSYDVLLHSPPAFEMGYWLVEEMSAIKDELAEREAERKAAINKYFVRVGADLSPRQTEILQGFANGGNTPSVAADLGITAETVKTNLKNARWKLQAKNTVHAVALAWRAGTIT